MPRFTKKPVTIEAMLFTDEDKNRVFHFAAGHSEPTWDRDNNPTLKIYTLEGEMTASFGDYVIKGIKGEFYPCKPDIFKGSYTNEDGTEIT